MRNLLLILTTLIVMVACDTPSNPQFTKDEPMPAKRPFELTIHGETRVDEYYWLRDDSRSDPKVLAYLEEENAHFKKE